MAQRNSNQVASSQLHMLTLSSKCIEAGCDRSEVMQTARQRVNIVLTNQIIHFKLYISERMRQPQGSAPGRNYHINETHTPLVMDDQYRTRTCYNRGMCTIMFANIVVTVRKVTNQISTPTQDSLLDQTGTNFQ